MIRYLFIGSVDYSAFCLKKLLRMKANIVGILCPKKGVSRFNSDYLDLGPTAKEFGRTVHHFEDIAAEADYIEGLHPDIIFALGISQLCPANILRIPSVGCIGSHPAMLPRNRGRHPIIWAIANGLKKSGVTLFWMDEGIDSGEIWSQRAFDIQAHDDAGSIYERVKELTAEMLEDGVSELEKGIIRRKRQDGSKSNYWRRRSEEDGHIDWRMSSERIHNLVRALAKPYVGAHCYYKNRPIKIWKTKMVNGGSIFRNLEPGKVVESRNGRIVVKTGDGLIELVKHGFEILPKKGSYL